MPLTRREFQKLALLGSLHEGLLWSGRPLHAQAPYAVPFQPFASQVDRLLKALEALGTPLPLQLRQRIDAAVQGDAQLSEAARVEEIVAALDARVLMEVEINPEMRLSVRRGSAAPELVQEGWRTFLVKVMNRAGTTPTLKINSPQGGPVGRHSSLAITGVHDFTNGAVDEVEARQRWMALDTFDMPPMTPTLSGLELEYRILEIYSRDAGEREATLRADAGYGEQDLGYRSSLPILFHIQPAHSVPLHILDENGAPSVGSLRITDALDRVYPPQTKRAMPDLNFQPQVYRYSGEHLTLAPGIYTVEFTRGPEYLLQTQTLNLAAASAAPLTLRLERWITPADHGYYSGDTHIHAAGCSHYESPTEGVTPLVMQRQVDGEALDLGAVLNWGPGFEYQKQFFTGKVLDPHPELAHVHHHISAGSVPDEFSASGANPQRPAQTAAPHEMGATGSGMEHDPAPIAAAQDEQIFASLQSSADTAETHSLLRYDIEVSGFPSSHCGHLVLLQLKEQRFPGTNSIDDWPSWNLPILRWAKAQGGVVGYAHSAHGLVVDSTELPNLVMPPFNSMGANEFIADVTHEGVIDFISGCDLWPFAELNIWYHTMNCGFDTAFAGETDFPCLTDACVGGGRSYVALPTRLSGNEGYRDWLRGLMRGSSYFGDGRSHLFSFKVQGQQRGSRPVRLERPGLVHVEAQVCARLEPSPTASTRKIQHASPYYKPYWHLERARLRDSRRVPVELIVNGVAVDRTMLEADGQVRPVTFDTRIDQSSWLALRIYPSSHTNPIVIQVDGKPVRASRDSAQWCRRAVDVCWEQKKQRIRPSELEPAAAAYDHARFVYDRILTEIKT